MQLNEERWQRKISYQWTQQADHPEGFESSYELVRSKFVKNAKLTPAEKKVFTYILVIIDDLEALFGEQRLHAFPAHSTITGSVNCSIIGVHKNDFVVVATPHQIVHLTIQVKCLKVNCSGHVLLLLVSLLVLSSHSGHCSSIEQLRGTEKAW